jgi:4-hydroxy-4-methyl-2-oxoglutarate aldolase
MTATATTLGRFGAATVHESGARGLLPRQIQPIAPEWQVAGRVFTVELAPGHNIWLHRAVYAAEPGDVLVVATSGAHDFGYWGDILTAAAIAVGLGGLVIDGCVRDARELVASGFPVFSRGLCVRGTGKDPDAGGGLDRLITVEGCEVHTGDVVVADADGVVVVGADQVDSVAAAALQRTDKETDIREQLRAGATTLDLYGFA